MKMAELLSLTVQPFTTITDITLSDIALHMTKE